jgi:hypothetical protein
MAYGDLTTLADVKAWLQTGQNPFPATDDALLQRLITAASQFIQSWLGRQIAAADWLEVRDGTGGQLMVLANSPITAVLSLSIDGLTIPAALADGGFDAGYTFTPTELALRGYVFTRRPQNVIVTYTAGYQTIPPDLAQACTELVCLRHRERSRIGEVSKALGGGETVTFSQKDMSDDVKTTLMSYRVAAPAGLARRLAPTMTDAALLAGAFVITPTIAGDMAFLARLDALPAAMRAALAAESNRLARVRHRFRLPGGRTAGVPPAISAAVETALQQVFRQ